jgi:hypothetical protein
MTLSLLVQLSQDIVTFSPHAQEQKRPTKQAVFRRWSEGKFGSIKKRQGQDVLYGRQWREEFEIAQAQKEFLTFHLASQPTLIQKWVTLQDPKKNVRGSRTAASATRKPQSDLLSIAIDKMVPLLLQIDQPMQRLHHRP